MAVDYRPTLDGYTGQGAFRWWAQKVLPFVFDDSLSYYEVLCKVTEYLNNTIKDVAAVEGNVDKLNEAYGQLQDYVNHYFDNLDVQDEINNKLDAMASDGSLSEAIEPAVATALPPIVSDQLSAVVAQQIDDVVADQIVDAAAESARELVPPLIPDAVTDWLDAHPEATTTVEDGSISPKKLSTGSHEFILGMGAFNAFVLDLWEQGSIYPDTGANANSSSRIRTIGYIPENIKTLRAVSPYGTFGLYAYLNDNFVGAWNNTTFSNAGDNTFNSVMDIGEIMRKEEYANYKYRLVYRESNADVTIQNVSGIILESYTNDYSKIDKAYNGIEQLNLSKSNNVNNMLLWERGSIYTATGVNVYNAYRFRTKYYLPSNVSIVSIENIQNASFFVLAYNSDDEYVGAYRNGDGFVKSDNVTGFKRFNIGGLSERYNYKYRLLVYSTDGRTITADEIYQFIMTSLLNSGNNCSITIIDYNIGRFNYGNDGGLSVNVQQKIQNYKEFLSKTNADYVLLQEYTENIDSEGTYNADETLFDPIFLNKSYYEHLLSIKSQRDLFDTKFSYLHTTSDNPAYVIYGTTFINGKTVAIATGALNASAPQGVSHTEQQLRALTKLTEQLLATYDYAIVGVDTNVINQQEAEAVKAFMINKGYIPGNWGYLGYKDTYNLSSSGYKSIDNVFVKGNMRISNFEVANVYDELSSDHFPVIVTVRI